MATIVTHQPRLPGAAHIRLASHIGRLLPVSIVRSIPFHLRLWIPLNAPMARTPAPIPFFELSRSPYSSPPSSPHLPPATTFYHDGRYFPPPLSSVAPPVPYPPLRILSSTAHPRSRIRTPLPCLLTSSTSIPLTWALPRVPP